MYYLYETVNGKVWKHCGTFQTKSHAVEFAKGHLAILEGQGYTIEYSNFEIEPYYAQALKNDVLITLHLSNHAPSFYEKEE